MVVLTDGVDLVDLVGNFLRCVMTVVTMNELGADKLS